MYRIGNEEVEELRKVIESRSLFRQGSAESGHQQAVLRFEREWGEMIGRKYTLCLSGGGTAALICSLVGLGIGPGDEVIVPAYTWMATALAVCAVGAIPVLADIDETLALDPQDLVIKLTPETRAVIPVHMVGRPANMESITEVAHAHNLYVVEDCCQSDGGSYQGKRLGSWGDAGAFSFNDFKIISAGEGGALVTDDRTVYERALVYHDAGVNFRNYGEDLSIPVFMGQQYRANELMGAVLRIQLQRLDGILADLRRLRRQFESELASAKEGCIAPNNDSTGDCGVVVAVQFEEEEQARAFATAPGVKGRLPIDSGKHVYTNWTPLLEHRVGHHPAVNPFLHPANQRLRIHYSPEMCAKTLEIMRRTVLIALHPDAAESEVSVHMESCCRSLRKMRKPRSS